MSDVQLENGYCRIANKIMDKLCKIRVPGETMQCLIVIIRKTYGFNKKQDCISLSQFEKYTGLKRPNICRALNKLKSMNLISIIKKDNGNIYKFNKHYELWLPLSKKITNKIIIKKDKKSLSKKIHTKYNSTKNNDISIFASFWELYPKKVAKKTAVKAFEKINPDKTLLQQMLKAIENQTKSKQWQDKQYIPHPATWLNRERWNDEIETISEDDRDPGYG